MTSVEVNVLVREAIRNTVWAVAGICFSRSAKPSPSPDHGNRQLGKSRSNRRYFNAYVFDTISSFRFFAFFGSIVQYCRVEESLSIGGNEGLRGSKI